MSLHVAPSQIDALAVWAAWPDAAGPYHLWWGDGASTGGSPGLPRTHLYPQAGWYTVTAVPADGSPVQRVQILVRSSTRPALTVTAGEDNPLILDLAVAEPAGGPISRYAVDWGDGGDPQTVVGVPGRIAASHGYRPGAYTVTARDLDTGRWFPGEQHELAEPAQDPNIALSRSDPNDRWSVTLTVIDPPAGKPMAVVWDDGSDDEPLGSGATNATHTYPETAAMRMVQVYYTDGSSSAAVTVDLPYPAPARGGKPAKRGRR